MDKEIGDITFGLQVSLGFVGVLLTQIVGFIGSVFLARIIGPEGYGLFYLSLGISKFFQKPVDGWGAACRKRVSETDFDTGEALGAVVIILLTVAITGAPLAYIFLGIMSENEVIPLAVPVLFISASAYLGLGQILSSRSNFALVEWGAAARTVLKVGLQAGLVVLGYGVWGMVGGAVAAPLLTLPILYFWINARPKIPSFSSLRSVGRYARWSIPTGFLGTGLKQIDVILFGWLATAGTVGKYQVAWQLSMPAALVSAAIARGLLGRISNLESRGKEWIPDYRNALSMESLLALPVLFGSLVMAESLVTTIFGNQYAGGGAYLVGLALFQVLDTQASPRESIIGGLDRPDIGFYSSILELIANVVLGIGLFYVYGPIGIVVATVLTQLLTYIFRILAVWYLTGITTVVTRPFLEQVGAGAIMAVIVWVMKAMIHHWTWHTVVALVILGGISYFAVLIAISPYFRSTATAIYGNIRTEYL